MKFFSLIALVASVSAIQWVGTDKSRKGDHPVTQLEHCPDFVERHTLANGATRAVAYPAKGYNCNPDYAHWSAKHFQWNERISKIFLDKKSIFKLKIIISYGFINR